MNIVSGAMRRPITVLVAIIAMVLGAALALYRMPRDIFPDLGIPVIYVSQPYGGMDPAQMEGYLTNFYEFHFFYIMGIEYIESKNIQGAALMKLQFHPGTDMAGAMAETINQVNRSRAFMPPGTVPPFVLRFDAGTVPVGYLVFSSKTRSVGEMQDLAQNRVRPMFATLPGLATPPPFGASQRTIVINVNPERLRAYKMPIEEVVEALNTTNLVSPSGNVRIGNSMPMVPMNAVVRDIKDLESLPIRTGSYPTVFLHDIGTVEDSTDIPMGYALVNGRRTVYIPVTKRANASTLAVVNLVKQNLPKFQGLLPEGIKVSYEFDQSPYVTRAIAGLTMEGALGAALTGLMILLFLRDWRSVFIVVITIPLSLLGSLMALWVSKQTVNIMTLGGLALSVGILVDEATVVMENIHTHLRLGRKKPGTDLWKPRWRAMYTHLAHRATVSAAALDGVTETRVPTFLTMLCILSVFIPSFFMTGPLGALFVPLSLAVGFSMVTSFVLSSTLVPVLATWILRPHPEEARGAPLSRFSFEAFRTGYARVVAAAIRLRVPLVIAYAGLAVLVIVWVGSRLGTEIFPIVDVGQFELRLRAPTGTRIERTEAVALQVLDTIKKEVGPDNVDISVGYVGIQPSSYAVNTIYLWTSGPEEAVFQVALRHGTNVRVEELKERLRRRLAAEMPDVRLSFEPSDIVSRIMSFGSLTPVEVAVFGPNVQANRAYAAKVHDALARIPSLRDLQYEQALDYPIVSVDLDRQRAGLMGVKTANVERSVVSATSSSRFVTPNFWADPKTGVGYQVQVQIPLELMNTVETVKNIPIARGGGREPALLRNIADVTTRVAPAEYDRYNAQRMVSLSANVSGEDLGTVSGRIARALKEAGAPPRNVLVSVRGQIAPLEKLLVELTTGLILTVVVIFLLLAANFQSLRLSFVVVSSVPAGIAGVVVALWLTRTTINIQSFMGAIMAVGIAVANAILLVTFAERNRLKGIATGRAAVEGARSRLRPILMTSLAMIAGMVPMALALGEGGEQTAPLGRAVIGGLVGATLATLTILPCVYAIIQGGRPVRSASLLPDETEKLAER